MWRIDDILRATGGELVCGDTKQTFVGVAIDSRSIKPDELFVALAGANHDAHRFVGAVQKAGGKGFVVEKAKVAGLGIDVSSKDAPLVVAVDDSTLALGALAAFHRRRLKAKVLGITGSNGKTTTKEMAAAVLARRFAVHKNTGNLNNHIGVPLTLLGLLPEHDWAVVEMGMNHPGEIRYLTGLAAPDAGLVTNVGPGHLEGVGSIEGVAAAKQEIFETMTGGLAILNADDPRVAAMAGVFGQKGQVYHFGINKPAHMRAQKLCHTPAGTAFELLWQGKSAQVSLAAAGVHMVTDAAAAACAGVLAGLSLEEAAVGLGDFTPLGGRQKVLFLEEGILLVDDTYNANPASMKSAISTLVALSGQGRAVAVLGDMLEMGHAAQEAHYGVGAFAAGQGVTLLLAAGSHAADIAAGALDAGMKPEAVMAGDKARIEEKLLACLAPKDRILVKGSRGMAMETLVRAVCNNFKPESGKDS
ncbi:MAG: UDP-N-acetylmuramoyl-tripeptide--D-alanyl-D-alanine ligase [Desulfatibacillaceae bacterium]|nr:UDP-N-acetylmuramoyl-tripeptide--D-alanyl-D-alanine ligase [Desulfatibacillaceae bacterium]